LNFNRLHGVISQKAELFITTAVRTSNPTCDEFLEQRANIKILVKLKKNTTTTKCYRKFMEREEW
jgi:hypothetical protein